MGQTEAVVEAVAAAHDADPILRAAVLHDAFVRAGRIDDGIAALTEFYACHPQVAPIAKADLEVLAGRFSQAKKSVRQCKQLDPRSALTTYLVGVVRGDLPRVELTPASFVEPLDIPRQLIRRGVKLWTRPLLRQLERESTILETHRDAIAGCWLDAGNPSHALKLLQPGTIDQKGSLAAKTIGCAYNRLGRFGEAMDWLRFGLTVEGGNSVLHFELSLALLGSGLHREALSECATAEELGHKSAATDWLRASILLAMGDITAAERLIDSLLEQNRGNVALMRLKGKQLWKAGKRWKAIHFMVRSSIAWLRNYGHNSTNLG